MRVTVAFDVDVPDDADGDDLARRIVPLAVAVRSRRGVLTVDAVAAELDRSRGVGRDATDEVAVHKAGDLFVMRFDDGSYAIAWQAALELDPLPAPTERLNR